MFYIYLFIFTLRYVIAPFRYLSRPLISAALAPALPTWWTMPRCWAVITITGGQPVMVILWFFAFIYVFNRQTFYFQCVCSQRIESMEVKLHVSFWFIIWAAIWRVWFIIWSIWFDLSPLSLHLLILMPFQLCYVCGGNNLMILDECSCSYS